MSNMIKGLVSAWQKNLDYAQRLVADLSPEQMIQQPVADQAPMNHPAWVLSHLNVYLPIIQSIIRSEEFEDPKGHQFGMQSKPELDAGLYATKEALLNEFKSGHEAVTQLLSAADDSVFDNEVMLPRWREPLPTAGDALPYLMLLHENTHLGQLSAWRRVLGLPSV